MQCSLSRRRMVLAATRRRRAPGPGQDDRPRLGSSFGARKGFSTARIPAPAPTASLARETEADSIAVSLSRKSSSTLSASAAISVFLAARLAGPSPRRHRRIGAGRDWRATVPATPPIALSPEVPEPDGRASPCGEEPPSRRLLPPPPGQVAAGRRLPAHRPWRGLRLSRLRLRSGASRSSSPAMPTRVKSA